MGKADAVCFRHEPEQTAITIKTPGASMLDDLKAGLVMAIQKDIRYSAGRVFVGEFERFRAKPLHANDCN